MSSRRYPQAAVSVVLRDRASGAFLLARRARPPAADLWAFPGGRVKWGETIRQAAAREIAEETAMRLDPDSLALAEVVDLIGDENHDGAPDHHFVLTVFTGRAEGSPRAGDDAAELRFVTVEEMASLPMTATTLATARRLAAR
ncbi:MULTISPECIES: NUDIX domain-containing protein [unclassified Roseitalea]|uniref:NUDIX hydrolase n=1 Tax=unclassified Roseitalea TaxID=2639107 RepID=UPI00273DFC4C|nr:MULTISPECIES: NUDIX domain-containing protein [unclassified Roseitalea]